jgi:hypothetical protein
MNKLLVCVLVLASISYSCEKNSVAVLQSLEGEWQWISTCGGIYYNCSTPESAHYNIRTVYSTDSYYSYFQDDTLKLKVKFNTYMSKSQDGKDAQVLDLITFGFDRAAFYYSISRDTLYLWNWYPEGFVSTYKRIK